MQTITHQDRNLTNLWPIKYADILVEMDTVLRANNVYLNMFKSSQTMHQCAGGGAKDASSFNKIGVISSILVLEFSSQKCSKKVINLNVGLDISAGILPIVLFHIQTRVFGLYRGTDNLLKE